MSLESLREWRANGGVRRAEHRALMNRMRKITWTNALRRAAARQGGDVLGPEVFEELHAEAITEAESRARPAPREPDYAAEMKLPPGKTCGDCHHVKRCLAFGFTSSAERTSCDFHPRRFADAGFPDDGWRQSALSAVREKVSP